MVPTDAWRTAAAASRKVLTGLPGSGVSAAPVTVRIRRTSLWLSPGLAASISAATPATFGVAPEVPPKPLL